MNRMPAGTPTHRHVDEGEYLNELADEVWVKCFRCESPGTVHAERNDWQWHAHFECKACDLALDSARGDWVGPVVASGRRPCGYCGHQWLEPRITQTEWPREVLTAMPVDCPECHHSSIVELSTQRTYDATECIDPHFGMPLWLVDAGRHGALWAYNAAHLRLLKSYVGATLRERSPAAGNASLLSRLPPWIKAAKNRKSILKRLERLDGKLPTAGSA